MKNIIAFSGLDGAGKSTQINLLKNKLIDNGNKVLVFWSRGGYTPGFQKLKDILRFILKSKISKPGKTKSREQALKQGIISKMWFSIALIDLIFFYSIYLRIKYLLGFHIILDRFIIDTEIDFKLNFPNVNYRNYLLWKILKKTSIKPHVNLILLISVEESKKRSLTKNEPFPDSVKVLNDRLTHYKTSLKVKNSQNFYKLVWCENSISYIEKEITNILKN